MVTDASCRDPPSTGWTAVIESNEVEEKRGWRPGNPEGLPGLHSQASFYHKYPRMSSPK